MKTTEEIKSLMLERKTFLETKISRLEEELDEASTELAELTLLIETGKIDWGQGEVEPEDNLGHWVHKTSGDRILVVREDEDTVTYRMAGSWPFATFPLRKEILFDDWEPEEPKPQGWLKPEKGSIWESGEIYYEVTESKEFGVTLMPLNGDGVSRFIRYQEFYESFKPVAWPLVGDTWEHKENPDWLATVTEVSKGSVTYTSGNSVWRSYIGTFLDEHRLAT